ncbi:MAG: hypothetical protein CMD66_05225 [Gammaproteobacteria bacterium]|nr:hypothetical protein [Gammaproteobacteria bacterium]
MQTYSLRINGMTCGGCAASIQRKLEALDGINQCEVNFATESARIESTAVIHPKQLIEWVRSFGFSVQTEEHRFTVSNTRFDERVLASLFDNDQNIVAYQLNPQLRTVSYTTLPDADHESLDHNLLALSMVQTKEVAQTSSTYKTSTEPLHAGIAAVLALPLVLQMIGMWVGSAWHLPVIVEWALATPIQFWLGLRFYKGAIAALGRREANMDTLVALGTTVAYIFSLYQWSILGDEAVGNLYFEASALVITLVLFGKSIENRAKQTALESLSLLLELGSKPATCLRAGREVSLAISELVSGDVLVIRTGERIGADGVVVRGEADIDASAMTGESVPEYKTIGDRVISGTLVMNGTLRVSAERVGKSSTVSQVAELVKNAQMGKAPIQKLVDQISRIFVPIILLLSIGTLGGWLALGQTLEYALIAAVSVLVIACPCALGLATPTALVAGTGLAAKKGILIKDIQTLEALPDVEVVAFDKTGTLTEGAPTVVNTESYTGDRETMIRRLVQVASESTHPLAQAIVRDLKDQSISTTDTSNAVTIPGRGISVDIGGHNYKLGRLEFVTLDSAEIDNHDNATRSYLSQDGALQGFAEFTDSLREEAQLVFKRLKAENKKTAMLTGDNEQVALALGRILQVDAIHAGLTPHQKIEVIESFQDQGQRVAMVGDGINDGPALARADVGIAMGGGNEIALKSAPVVLMRSDLRLIPEAIHYARLTRRVIRQNLGWAFGYNILCIPLAMSGLLTPTIAGAAMALSSISVVGNALRLKYSD